MKAFFKVISVVALFTISLSWLESMSFAGALNAAEYLQDLKTRIEKAGIEITDNSKNFIDPKLVPESVLHLFANRLQGSSWEGMIKNAHPIRVQLSPRTDLYAITSGYWERDQRFLYIQHDKATGKARLFPFPVEGIEGVVKEGIFGSSGYDPSTGIFLLKISLAHFSERTLWCWNQRIFAFQLHAPNASSGQQQEFEKIALEPKLIATLFDCKSEPLKVIRFTP